jgi:hypothetical protein
MIHVVMATTYHTYYLWPILFPLILILGWIARTIAARIEQSDTRSRWCTGCGKRTKQDWNNTTGWVCRECSASDRVNRQ